MMMNIFDIIDEEINIPVVKIKGIRGISLFAGPYAIRFLHCPASSRDYRIFRAAEVFRRSNSRIPYLRKTPEVL
jgi:hypothetical protein